MLLCTFCQKYILCHVSLCINRLAQCERWYVSFSYTVISANTSYSSHKNEVCHVLHRKMNNSKCTQCTIVSYYRPNLFLCSFKWLGERIGFNFIQLFYWINGKHCLLIWSILPGYPVAQWKWIPIHVSLLLVETHVSSLCWLKYCCQFGDCTTSAFGMVTVQNPSFELLHWSSVISAADIDEKKGQQKKNALVYQGISLQYKKQSRKGENLRERKIVN